MSMRDDLGDRQKRAESVTRFYLPTRTNMMIRVDGRALSTYTKHCQRPFDEGLMADMDQTAIALAEEVQGAKLLFVQSDEITLWATDYDGLTTTPWFDGNVQKITSIAAAVATARFNQLVLGRYANQNAIHLMKGILDVPLAHFDARVWTIAQLSEVANTFLWRCQDASRNSVQMLARSLYSHAECEGRSNSELQEMTWRKGQNWNDLPAGQKAGRIIVREKRPGSTEVRGETIHFERNVWVSRPVTDWTYEAWSKLVCERVPAE